MAESNNAIEERILDALATISDNEKPNIAKLARENNVPYQRLLACYKGRQSILEQSATNLQLNLAQELVLCQYLDTLNKVGISTQRQMLINCANSIL